MRNVTELLPTRYAADDDISLKELLSILWRGKWLIIAVTLSLGIAAGAASFAVPKTYKASIIVAPMSDRADQAGALASMASAYGGLASLAGISLGGNDKRSEAIAILSSSGLSARYIREQNLIPVLFPDLRDPVTGKWRTDNSREIPTPWQATMYFTHRIRSVSEDPKTGMVTVTVSWKDPAQAARWANDLVRMTNDYLRSRAIEESEAKIAYLQDQVSKTKIVAVQNAIYSVLEMEIKAAMMARGTREYAFRVIDYAVPPESPASPNPVLWALAGLFAGFFSSALFVFARSAWRAAR